MEAVASYITVVEVAARLCRSVAGFVYEARDANETAANLVKRVATLHSTLEAVHDVLEKRESQRQARTVTPLDDDVERGVWDRALKILQRCDETVQRFEAEVNRLGRGKSESWPSLILLQLKLNTRNPAIARIEKDIDSNVSSVQLMITWFQPFMHEETQVALRDGFAAQNLAAENIYKAIQQMQTDIAKLLLRSNDFEGQDLDVAGRSTDAAIAADASDDGTVLDNVKLMEGDVLFASSLAESMSAGGQTVDGTSRHRSHSITSRDIRNFGNWKPVSSSGSHGDDEQDVSGEASLSEIGADSLMTRADTLNAATGDYYSPMTRADTPNAATGNYYPPTRGNLSNGLDLDTTEPDEIIIAHIDRCYDRAKQAYSVQDYSRAETDLLEAIAPNALRDKGVTFGSLPVQRQPEFRQLLARIMSKNFKFNEAAQEYWALIGEARYDADRLSSLCFALAEVYQAQYAHERKKEVLKEAEACAMHAFKSALIVGTREGNPPWPKEHPSVQQTVQVLVGVFEATGRVHKADIYREWYLTGTNAQAPPVPPLGMSPPMSPPPRRLPPPILSPPPSPPRTVSHPSIPQSPCTSSSGSIPRSVPMPKGLDRIINSNTADPIMRKYFLLNYDNIEERDENNLTPLLLACKSKKIADVRVLLARDNGPDLTAQDSGGCTSLHLAIIGGPDGGIGDDIVRLLINHRANVNTHTNAEENMTPLHYAAKLNKPRSAAALLDAGADIDARDHVDRSPLMLALRENKEEMCRLLVRRGATHGRRRTMSVYGDLWDDMDRAQRGSLATVRSRGSGSGESERSRFSFLGRRSS